MAGLTRKRADKHADLRAREMQRRGEVRDLREQEGGSAGRRREGNEWREEGVAGGERHLRAEVGRHVEIDDRCLCNLLPSSHSAGLTASKGPRDTRRTHPGDSGRWCDLRNAVCWDPDFLDDELEHRA
eukprot:3493750-Rhodomonas_salina.2